MTIGIQVFSNLIAPVVTGLFFFFYFMYFLLAGRSTAPSFKYFVLFLIGFSIFSFGRALQLLLGPYPVPLIIVNVRVLILCAVVSPSIILAADVLHDKNGKSRAKFIVVSCIVLGLIYDLFNTLGTHASYVVFRVAGIVAHDNLTPAMLPPFYGREVTIGVQLIVATLLLLFSTLSLLRIRLSIGFMDRLRDRDFLTNAGIVVFAASFIFGSLAKQWWVYYAASIISALLIGTGVLLDAREVRRHYDKLVPFIKEDIINNVVFGGSSPDKIVELLNGLGKTSNLDRFVVMRITGTYMNAVDDLAGLDHAIGTAQHCLSRIFGADLFLLLPLSESRIGVVLQSPAESGDGKETHILDALEEVREELCSRCGGTAAIGVGRRYDTIENLGSSYREALSALEYAEQFDGSTIIHVEDVNPHRSRGVMYPAREKERLMSQIRLGDIEGTRAALNGFVARFRVFVQQRPDLLVVRLYELVDSLIDSAVLGGGDEEKLNQLSRRYTSDLDLIKDYVTAEPWLTRISIEIAESVVHVRKRRTNSLVARAVTYVHANYQLPLSYRDVAREIGISPSYFRSLFKKETGMTFVDFLTGVRIEAAKGLLLTSDSTITEIAFDVGFNSSNYFSSIFHKIVGASPKEYRDQRVQEPATSQREV